MRADSTVHKVWSKLASQFCPRLSGYDPDEEEDEFDELQEKAAHPERLVRRFSFSFSVFLNGFFCSKRSSKSLMVSAEVNCWI